MLAKRKVVTATILTIINDRRSRRLVGEIVVGHPRLYRLSRLTRIIA